MEYLFGLCWGSFFSFLFCHFFFKRPIKLIHPGWLDISTNPLPEDATDYLITDGNITYHQYSPDFNNKGQVIFSYKRLVATHWMHYPSPPEKELLKDFPDHPKDQKISDQFSELLNWKVVESRSNSHPDFGFPMGKFLCRSQEEANEYISKSEFKDCFIKNYLPNDEDESK